MRLTRKARSALLLIGFLGAPATPLTLLSSTSAAEQAQLESPLQSARLPSAPLQGSIARAETTWATLLMGKRDGDFDLFWQLFVFRASTRHWALVTPPGVADNGGLIISANSAGTSLLAGFGTSNGLKFSPLAMTSTGGTSWAAGGLDYGLLPRPSALAFSKGGTALALVGSTNAQLLALVGSLTNWKRLESTSQLQHSSDGKRCGVKSLEAVAFATSGDPLLGAACARPGIVGIFSSAEAKWRLVQLRLPDDLDRAMITVLRLDPGSALLEAREGKTTEILAAQATTSGTWQLSSPLRVKTGAQLLATGTGPGGAQSLLVRIGTTLTGMVVSGSPASWHELAPLPSGSATLAFEPSGELEALGVDGTRFTAWQLSANRGHWTVSQVIKVPIQFGSSG